MYIDRKSAFLTAIKNMNIDTEYVVIKPNWINDKEGEYTESKILGWLLEALPGQKKIVIEGYTPWRGLIYHPKDKNDDLKVDLVGGKKYREFYRSLDLDFLRRTGIGEILEKHHAEYINVTECVWNDDCVPSEIITNELSSIGYALTNPVFASYLPKRMYDLRTKATLISLAKIKSQFHDPSVGFSGTIKNIFGLLPDPSRMKYHAGENMMGLDTALADIFLIYYLVFREARWIAEGIFNFSKEPFSLNPSIVKNQNTIFLGENPFFVDAEVCKFLGVKPETSEYYQNIKKTALALKLLISRDR